MKQQKLRRSKGKKTKKLRMNNPRILQNRHDFEAVFASCHYETEDFLRFWPFFLSTKRGYSHMYKMCVCMYVGM